MIRRHTTKASAKGKRTEERVDRIHNHSLTERERALEALAMMKRLEKKHRSKMVSVQADDRTVLCSNNRENLKMRVKEYTEIKKVTIK